MPPGKQKATKSFIRRANFFPGGYLKSICRWEKRKETKIKNKKSITIMQKPHKRGPQKKKNIYNIINLNQENKGTLSKSIDA